MLARGFDRTPLAQLDHLVTTTAYQIIQQRLAAGRPVTVTHVRELQAQLITGRAGHDPDAITNQHVAAFVNAKLHGRVFPAAVDLTTADGISRSATLETDLVTHVRLVAGALWRAEQRGAQANASSTPLLTGRIRSAITKIIETAARPDDVRNALDTITKENAPGNPKTNEPAGPTR